MIRIVWDADKGGGDFSCGADGTDTRNPLETAVILSLFCDARADAGDDVHDGIDRRGWWAQSYFDDDHVWGSKLWQVLMGKATQGALQRAQRACEDALQWLIRDGVCSAVEVDTWWIEGRQGYMGIRVVLQRPDKLDPQYAGPWEVQYAMD